MLLTVRRMEAVGLATFFRDPAAPASPAAAAAAADGFPPPRCAAAASGGGWAQQLEWFSGSAWNWALAAARAREHQPCAVLAASAGELLGKLPGASASAPADAVAAAPLPSSTYQQAKLAAGRKVPSRSQLQIRMRIFELRRPRARRFCAACAFGRKHIGFFAEGQLHTGTARGLVGGVLIRAFALHVATSVSGNAPPPCHATRWTIIVISCCQVAFALAAAASLEVHTSEPTHAASLSLTQSNITRAREAARDAAAAAAAAGRPTHPPDATDMHLALQAGSGGLQWLVTKTPSSSIQWERPFTSRLA